jgi:hypothetical protein
MVILIVLTGEWDASTFPKEWWDGTTTYAKQRVLYMAHRSRMEIPKKIKVVILIYPTKPEVHLQNGTTTMMDTKETSIDIWSKKSVPTYYLESGADLMTLVEVAYYM